MNPESKKIAWKSIFIWIIMLLFIFMLFRVPYVGSYIDDYTFKPLIGYLRFPLYLAIIYITILALSKKKVHKFIRVRLIYIILFLLGTTFFIGSIPQGYGTQVISHDFSKFWAEFINEYKPHIGVSNWHEGFQTAPWMGLLGGMYFWIFNQLNPETGALTGWFDILAFGLPLIIILISISGLVTFKPLYLYIWMINKIVYALKERRFKKHINRASMEERRKYPFIEKTQEVNLELAVTQELGNKPAITRYIPTNATNNRSKTHNNFSIFHRQNSGNNLQKNTKINNNYDPEKVQRITPYKVMDELNQQDYENKLSSIKVGQELPINKDLTKKYDYSNNQPANNSNSLNQFKNNISQQYINPEFTANTNVEEIVNEHHDRINIQQQIQLQQIDNARRSSNNASYNQEQILNKFTKQYTNDNRNFESNQNPQPFVNINAKPIPQPIPQQPIPQQPIPQQPIPQPIPQQPQFVNNRDQKHQESKNIEFDKYHIPIINRSNSLKPADNSFSFDNLIHRNDQELPVNFVAPINKAVKSIASFDQSIVKIHANNNQERKNDLQAIEKGKNPFTSVHNSDSQLVSTTIDFVTNGNTDSDLQTAVDLLSEANQNTIANKIQLKNPTNNLDYLSRNSEEVLNSESLKHIHDTSINFVNDPNSIFENHSDKNFDHTRFDINQNDDSNDSEQNNFNNGNGININNKGPYYSIDENAHQTRSILQSQLSKVSINDTAIADDADNLDLEENTNNNFENNTNENHEFLEDNSVNEKESTINFSHHEVKNNYQVNQNENIISNKYVENTNSASFQENEYKPSNIDNDAYESDEDLILKKKLIFPNYKFPSLKNLDKSYGEVDHAKLEAFVKTKIERLLEVLKELNIKLEFINYKLGPSILRIHLRPFDNFRINDLSKSIEELRFSVGDAKIAFYSPVNDTNNVAIDVPLSKQYRQIVSFYEVLTKSSMQESTSELEVVLGKNNYGNPEFLNLTTAPHMLIAGATGSGKSVAINVIIMSLIIKYHPSHLRLLLIDPKKVELSVFKDIPHLMCPILTDVQAAILALKELTVEMDHRYKFLSEHGAKNIAAYNAKVPFEEQLPYIVVIIDELADLILVNKLELEGNIMRITQLARAAGIHLILATQRPSVNIITGVIKSNIPTRIAFSVPSNTDSRTILDTKGSIGAEKLLGNGDMLLMRYGSNEIERIQGSYISDSNIEMITNSLTKSSKQIFDNNYMDLLKKQQSLSKNEVDPLFEEARIFVSKCLNSGEKVKATLLQSQYSIGWPRAKSILKQISDSGLDWENKV